MLVEAVLFLAVLVWQARTHVDQIQTLLDRIQAPETVVARTLTEDYEPLVLPHTEDTYWTDVQKDHLAPELEEVE